MKTLREMIDIVEAAQTGQHYRHGEMAAVKGVPYRDNPHPSGSKEHLEWSKGHNNMRAKKNSMPSDIEEDQATAKMGLMSAMGSNSGAPDRQRMAQQAVERLASEK